MVKAVITGGQIQPLEPLPRDWQEGQQVRIEKLEEHEPTVEEIDRDFAELAALCADSDAADEERLQRALEEAHRAAKEQVRRQMGLS